MDLNKRVRELVNEKLGIGSRGTVLLKDADGKTFPLAAGEHVRGQKAPAYVRPGALGDRPIRVSDAIEYIREGNAEKVPLVVHIDQEFRRAGWHPHHHSRALMFPLTSDPTFLCPQNSADDQLAALIKDAMPVAEDPALTKWLVEKFAGVGSIKAMDPVDDALGGALVGPPGRGELLELLRARLVFRQAGAEMIAMPPSGSIQYPRETGAITFQWLSATESLTAADLATGMLTLVAKKVGGIVKLPNDLIRFGGAEAVIRRALSMDAAIAADLAYYDGEGGAAKPLGLSRYGRSADDTPTADKITLHNAGTTGTNGDTFLPEDPLQMMALVEEAPDAAGPSAFLMRPLMWAGLANARADAVTAADKKGPFMFPITRGDLGNVVRKELQGLPVVTSTQIPNTRRKGTLTNGTEIVCGNFGRALVALAGVVELAASEHAGFISDQTWIRAVLRSDFALKYAPAFCICPTLILPS